MTIPEFKKYGALCTVPHSKVKTFDKELYNRLNKELSLAVEEVVKSRLMAAEHAIKRQATHGTVPQGNIDMSYTDYNSAHEKVLEEALTIVSAAQPPSHGIVATFKRWLNW